MLFFLQRKSQKYIFCLRSISILLLVNCFASTGSLVGAALVYVRNIVNIDLGRVRRSSFLFLNYFFWCVLIT